MSCRLRSAVLLKQKWKLLTEGSTGVGESESILRAREEFNYFSEIFSRMWLTPSGPDAIISLFGLPGSGTGVPDLTPAIIQDNRSELEARFRDGTSPPAR
jgi:hypothetical protein